ncbi:MAG: ChaN family lipoprotein, partial [Litorimonas sp.]
DSHCGMIPKETARSMVESQRLRDAVFAARTADAHRASPGPAPVVLVTGTGHARKDRGVPAYLARVVPDAEVVVVGLVEADTGPQDGLYDIVRVTPPAERPDPCEAFR